MDLRYEPAFENGLLLNRTPEHVSTGGRKKRTWVNPDGSLIYKGLPAAMSSLPMGYQKCEASHR